MHVFPISAVQLNKVLWRLSQNAIQKCNLRQLAQFAVGLARPTHTPLVTPSVRKGVARETELITLEINMRLEAPTSHKSDRHINPVLHISLADRDRGGNGDGSCDVDVDVQSSNLQLCCVWERNTHTHTCTEWEWGEVSMARARSGREGERGGETWLLA